ncbi:MAG: hypothetical protein ACLPZR_02000 [Solirubrobacteraceae bacterium]
MMTTAEASVRPRLRAGRRSQPARSPLLRIELRRNAMVWIAPVTIVLFYFTTYRPVMALPALWSLRTLTMQTDALIAFGPFVAGAAAWMGSREGRRDTAEMVAGTARARWSAQLATWGATTLWALGSFAVCVAAVYGATAIQVSWGAAEWWPAAVDAAWIVALSAAGFTAGALLPSRFAAPLAAVITAVALELAFHAELPATQPGPFHRALEFSPYTLALPTIGQPLIPFDAGVYYPFLPDLSIVQTMLGAGLAAVAIGGLGLREIARRGARRLVVTALALTLAGIAASVTVIALAGTAARDAHGMIEIPALHDGADDHPSSYTPACDTAAIPVCVHPAFRSELAGLARMLRPVERNLARLAGVPVRIDLNASANNQLTVPEGTSCQRTRDGLECHSSALVAGYSAGTLSGTPPTLHFAFDLESITGSTLDAAAVENFVQATIGASGNTARAAIAGALVHEAGIPLGVPDPIHPPPPNVFALSAPALAAARRFSELPVASQHAWIRSHWSALRAGEITLAQLP